MGTNTLTTLPWNLATKNFHGHDQLRRKIRQKISKLERHLVHFPDRTVHLHIALERHPRKKLFIAALTLRVPSNILRSEKSASDIIKAFDDAVRALLRELEALKSELRGDAYWKRKRIKSSGFAPEPQAEGAGPQNLSEVVRALLEQENRRLLRYVRRHLWHEIVSGDLPREAIDPQEVVDEVARRALAAPDKKPSDRNYQLWLYALARQEIARCRKELKTQAAETVSLETPRELPEDAELASGYDPEQPLDIIEQRLEPPVAETKDLVPDQRTELPAEIVERRDLLARTRKLASTWPKPERDVFELYFVEGFELDEIAMLVGQPLAKVKETVSGVQNRLRDEVRRQSEI